MGRSAPWTAARSFEFLHFQFSAQKAPAPTAATRSTVSRSCLTSRRTICRQRGQLMTPTSCGASAGRGAWQRRQQLRRDTIGSCYHCFARKDITSRLPRSASIDSMVETVWAESFVEPLQQKSSQPRQFQRLPVEKRASVTSRASDRTLALVSPSVGRRLKGHRSVNGECKHANDPVMFRYRQVGKKTRGIIRAFISARITL